MRIVLILLVVALNLSFSPVTSAGDYFGRLKGGWLGFTGAENVTALNSGGYIPGRQGMSADGFAFGLDLGYRCGNWDLGLTGARTIISASSDSYVAGLLPTFDLEGARARRLYLGFLIGGMFVTQQNFVSSAITPTPSSFSINRFALGPVAGMEREVTRGLDLGVQFQYVAAFGPDQDLGAASIFVTVGHSFRPSPEARAEAQP